MLFRNPAFLVCKHKNWVNDRDGERTTPINCLVDVSESIVRRLLNVCRSFLVSKHSGKEVFLVLHGLRLNCTAVTRVQFEVLTQG